MKCVMFCILMSTMAAAAVIRVPADYRTIQEAIDAAADSDRIIVAAGEYVISEPITFRGKNINLAGESAETTTIRMAAAPLDPKRASVVVFENGERLKPMLENFTLTGGKGVLIGDDAPEAHGGGVLVRNNSTATIRQCTIVSNEAVEGAGIWCDFGTAITILHCTVASNAGIGIGWRDAGIDANHATIADNSGPGLASGGSAPFGSTFRDCAIRGNGAAGVHLGDDSSTSLTQCTIAENAGPGVYCGDCGPTISACIISGNGVAGIDSSDSSPKVTNCLITGNRGPGVLCRTSDPMILNCTISGNRGFGVLARDEDCFPHLTNCIVWGSSEGSISLGVEAKISVDYSCLEGATMFPGTRSVDQDPQFKRHGHWDDNGTPEQADDDVWLHGDYRLAAGSPCTDRGTPDGAPATDIANRDRPCGAGIDMGAYESDCPALPAEFKRGDANADSDLNVADAIFVLGYLFNRGPEPGCLEGADINDDVDVNVADAIAFLAYLFAKGPEPPSPFDGCGADPSPPGLGCVSYPPCAPAR